MIDLDWFLVEEVPLRFLPDNSLVIGGYKCSHVVLVLAELDLFLLVSISLPNENLRMADDLHLSAALTLGLTL